ncbi:hypothetical protein O3Q52_25380 [Streptomyces sp. ActVer]|uniref:hypothetical protein n=1 Tax=Streptomyces sp. ActVer TaxID=3014558 RepID=UPI0022B37DE1|nr:hypothetical protein [Streptomyces sp. ActVer]MCZ4511460.1 hypothetical protein [Streptomyces sp. ActVer]
MAMDEDESLHRYGLHPAGANLDEVRGLLAARTRLEKRAQGDGDTELMKLCCVQLFNAGTLGVERGASRLGQKLNLTFPSAFSLGSCLPM